MLFTLDLETTVKCHVAGQHKASPHYAGNYVVCSGWDSGTVEVADSLPVTSLHYAMQKVLANPNETLVLCGFNIGFDLAYLVRHGAFRQWLHTNLHRIKVWDVQYAAYMLSGHQWMYPSLDDVAALYGLPAKPDKIKEYWDGGWQTEDIPRKELLEYQAHDISVTRDAANHQAKKLMTVQQRNLCLLKGDDILYTTLMEHNGMKFDLDICGKIGDDVRVELNACMDKMHYIVKGNTRFNDFAPTKNAHVETFLYGGEFKTEERVADGVYKTGLRVGQPKTKIVKSSVAYDGILADSVAKEARSRWGRSVSDQVLEWLQNETHPEHIDAQIFLTEIRLFRGLHKDVATYYDGYAEKTWDDGVIRPQYNHCATVTSRLTCTKPNLQNTSKGEE
jgi:DNA polymerase I-like protein with 3'-5' exonuclease and polymerase domains